MSLVRLSRLAPLGLLAASAAAFSLRSAHAEVSERDTKVTPPDLVVRQTPASELVRSWIVFTACQCPFLIDNSPKLLSTLQSIPLLRQATNTLVRHTFFAQFVGGDDDGGCVPLIRTLKRRGIGTLLAYSVEATPETEDVKNSLTSEELWARSRREAKKHVEETCNAIAVSGQENRASGGEAYGSTWVAVKLSGLMTDHWALKRTSDVMRSLRVQHPTGPASRIQHPGSTSERDLALLVSTDTGPLSLAPSDVREMRNLMADMKTILDKAQAERVRIIVDAEWSWSQPSIDAVVMALSKEYNKLPRPPSRSWLSWRKDSSSIAASSTDTLPVQPLVYGTYQAYLRRNVAHIHHAMSHARAHNYSVGVKLVRGAYHCQEVEQWEVNPASEPSPPVWTSKEDTDRCYNESAEVLVREIARDVDAGGDVPTIGVLLGTHNAQSVNFVVANLAKYGLATEDPEQAGRLRVKPQVRRRFCFGQLYGMCDTLTNTIASTIISSPSDAPLVLKYVPYGNLLEVMPYLGRRAFENKSVLGSPTGAKDEAERAAQELKRRVFGSSV